MFDPSYLRLICSFLDRSAIQDARELARMRFPNTDVRPSALLYRPSGLAQPLITEPPSQPVVPARAAMKIHMRDGFIDRYSGQPLVCPPALWLLSMLLPEEFPYSGNWKAGSTHPLYWQVSATCSRLLTAGRGGKEEPGNLVSASMLSVEVKGAWTIDELGWSLVPARELHEWDGLAGWFRGFVERNPGVISNPPVDEGERLHKARMKAWLPTIRNANLPTG